MSKYLLITDSDLDGVGCAILMGIFFPNNHTQFCTAKDVNQCVCAVMDEGVINNYEKVFITDLSVNADNAIKISVHNGSLNTEHIQLLDHHNTAMWLVDNHWANVAVKTSEGTLTCGTRLFWEYIQNNHPDVIDRCSEALIHKCHKFVELVRLYDTFEWKTNNILGTGPVDLNYLLSVYERKEFIDNFISRITDDSIESSLFSQDDTGIAKCMRIKKSKYFKHKMKVMQTITYEGYTVAVVYADEYVSELGNYICEQDNTVDFAVLISVENETVSLRSTKDDVDVSKIAKKFGGGGHKHAAGYVLKDRFNPYIISNLFTK